MSYEVGHCPNAPKAAGEGELQSERKIEMEMERKKKNEEGRDREEEQKGDVGKVQKPSTSHPTSRQTSREA